MSVYLVTSAFCTPETFRLGMERLQRSAPNLKELGATHIIWDQYYPKEHDELLRAIHTYGSNAPHRVVMLTEGRDVGLTEAFNKVVEYIQPEPDDIVIGVDPDTDIERPGWIEAMCRVFEADPSCGWLSLAVKYVRHHQLNTSTPDVVGGEHVFKLPVPLQMDVCGFPGRALAKVGKFTEPNQYYGGVELAMWPRFAREKFWIGIMADYEVQGRVEGVDPEYLRWKRYHVGFEQPQFFGSFAEWLKR